MYMDLNAPDPDDETDSTTAITITASTSTSDANVFQFSDLKISADEEEVKGRQIEEEECKGEENFLYPEQPTTTAPTDTAITSTSVAASASADCPPPTLSAAACGTAGGLHRYFGSLTSPAPRINPCLMLRGNTLYVYGGVTELGDIEVDLNYRFYCFFNLLQ